MIESECHPIFFLLNVAHLGRPPENWVSFPSKYVKNFHDPFFRRTRWWFTWMMIISSSLGCRFRFFASEFFLGFIGGFKWVTPSHLQKGETRYDRWQLEHFLECSSRKWWFRWTQCDEEHIFQMGGVVQPPSSSCLGGWWASHVCFFGGIR